jgi:UDP-N-acetylglucosamine--N-acetylmuramyl-(pentapeptide) pyrophosphoryl-undecaprenol N-acetylglucosamine transferase
MRKATRVLLTGGGSGGHILPNLAIASALKALDPSLDLLYVGSRLPLDASLVKSANLPFKAILTGKLRRYFDWRNFTDPFLIVAGFFQALWIVARFWPSVVFAKGGFVTLPVSIAAFLLRRPTVLHESDQVMGLSNRIVATLAKKVCVGFPEVMSDNPKTVFTGNPVRLSIRNGSLQEGYRLTGFRPDKPVLFVWGGSQGAEEINRLVASEFHQIKSIFQIIHIVGAGKKTDLQSPDYAQFEYANEELPHLYAIAEVVVGRAGANSLYELALLQRPNILIPLKSSAHNHQAMNADYFERVGASVVLKQGQPLFEVLEALWHNPAQIGIMKVALGKLAKPEAAETIARIVLGLETRN